MTTPELIEKHKAQVERFEKWLNGQIQTAQNISVNSQDEDVRERAVIESETNEFTLTKLREILKP